MPTISLGGQCPFNFWWAVPTISLGGQCPFNFWWALPTLLPGGQCPPYLRCLRDLRGGTP
jgi:hypothetical protein